MGTLLTNIILLLLEAAFVFMVVPSKKTASKLYCCIAFTQLFIFHAFLDPYKMVDLPNYIDTFYLVAERSLQESLVGHIGVKMEIGWIVLCKLLSTIWDNYIILLLFTSLIIVGGYCITIKKYSPIVWLSIFIFVCTTYNQSLFVLRQHTAMALCLLSIPSIVKKKHKSFLFTITVASLLHITAIIFIFVYVLALFRYNSRFWIIIISMTVILSLTSSVVFEWLFSNTWYGSYSEKEGSNYTAFLMALFTLILYLYAVKWKTTSLNPIEKCFLTMAVLAVILSFVGVGFSPTNRLCKYFSVCSIFLIPISITKFKNCVIRMLITVTVLIFYILLFFSHSNLTYIQDYNLI